MVIITTPDRNSVENDVAGCKPDVVLMDVDMPKTDGIVGTAQLRLRFPDLRIIMLTVLKDDDRIFSALRAKVWHG